MGEGAWGEGAWGREHGGGSGREGGDGGVRGWAASGWLPGVVVTAMCGKVWQGQVFDGAVPVFAGRSEGRSEAGGLQQRKARAERT